MDQTIKDCAKQFLYEPVIENNTLPGSYSRFIVSGMGGSNLAAALIKRLDPALDISSHRNYGLPHISDPARTLLIATSFSGNTEETLSSYEEALVQNIPVLAITTGGKLLELAQKNNKPYIQLPSVTIQPRTATGYILMATLKAIGNDALFAEIAAWGKTFDPSNYEKHGQEMAGLLKDKVPVIYASEQNTGIAYNWKIKFNETGKIPAFYNILPELNHNEMTGFDTVESTKPLSEKFSFILLRDGDDHPRIVRRMLVLEEILRKRGFQVIRHELLGARPIEKIVSSICIADWASYYTALHYGVEAEQVPLVEEFKRAL